jgi:hypothetical protein
MIKAAGGGIPDNWSRYLACLPGNRGRERVAATDLTRRFHRIGLALARITQDPTQWGWGLAPQIGRQALHVLIMLPGDAILGLPKLAQGGVNPDRLGPTAPPRPRTWRTP